MFETKKSSSGIYPIVAATLCFVGGYALATYSANNADVQISTGPNDEVMLSYKKASPRILRADNNIATLGTLRERLDDLLNEEPKKIRQLTRESLGR